MNELQAPTKIRPPHPSKGMNKAAYKAHRKKHVKLWQASGLSKTAYAASINISKESFCDWVKSFGSSPLHPSQTTLMGKQPQTSQVKSTIIPVRIQNGATAAITSHAPTGQMKLMLHNGIALEWSQPPQTTWLLELLKGLP